MSTTDFEEVSLFIEPPKSTIVDSLSNADGVLVVDVSNLAHRCLHAYSELKTSTGVLSGHVYGCFKILLSTIQNNLMPKKWLIAFCYDTSNSKNSRRAIMPSYKANRDPAKFSPLPDAAAALASVPGVHIVNEDREADDAIFWFSVACAKMRKEVVVLSGDKDLWPLIAYGCTVHSPNLGRGVGIADVEKRFFVSDPRKIPFVKALFGDPSDNVKGPERLFKKHVIPHLESIEELTVENFMQAVKDAPPDITPAKTKGKVLGAEALIRRNLTVIRPHVDNFSVTKHLKKSTASPENKAALEGIFKKYEFESLVGRSGIFFGDDIYSNSSIEEMVGLEKTDVGI